MKRLLSPSIRSFLNTRLRRTRKASYSQFGEDSVLFSYFAGKEWRYGKRTGKSLRRPGFYVDIGAYAPSECSNTYLFYRTGWRGINIDAAPGSMSAFRLVRPRDINLQVAIGSKETDIRFYVWSRAGVFNTTSASVAKERELHLGIAPSVVTVPCMTLARVLDERLPPGQSIDFLSVDAEGRDLDVLESNDWNRYRPELIVVEDDTQSIEALNSSAITSFLRDQGYRIFAWAPPSVIHKRVDG